MTTQPDNPIPLRISTLVCRHCGGNGRVVDNVDAGRVFRSLRKLRNMAAKDMAAALSISPQYLHDLEWGRRRWTLDIRKRCAVVLQLTAEEIPE